jgi:hypothetical protein
MVNIKLWKSKLLLIQFLIFAINKLYLKLINRGFKIKND